MSRIPDKYRTWMKEEVKATFGFLGIEISQLCVFLPDREDDLDVIDHLRFRCLLDEKQVFVAGGLKFSIFDDFYYPEEHIRYRCRYVITSGIMEKLDERIRHAL